MASPNQGNNQQRPQQPLQAPQQTGVAQQSSGPPSSPQQPVVTRWRVMVRHSPFPLKKAEIDAYTVAEAKEKFLKAAHDLNEKKCRETLEFVESQDRVKAVKARREAFARAVAADQRGELEWVILDANEAHAKDERLKERRAAAWGEPGRIAV